MAAPFVILSIFIGYLIIFLKKATKTIKYINVFSGIVLVAMGILLLTNKLYLLYTPG
jgi:cytochrome c-type biogenesis protein